MQCTQGNMADSSRDCEGQARVVCAPGSFCFTRQILLGQGQNAVEKMCVTEKALVEEYGQEVSFPSLKTSQQVNTNGCSATNEDAVRFCVCQSEECNKPHIDIQVNLFNFLSNPRD